MNLKTHSNAFSPIKSKNPNPYTVRKQLSPWFILTSLLGLESSSPKYPPNSHPRFSRSTYFRVLLKRNHNRQDFPAHLTYIQSPSIHTCTLSMIPLPDFLFSYYMDWGDSLLSLPPWPDRCVTHHRTFLLRLLRVSTTRMQCPRKQGLPPSYSPLRPQQSTSGM